MASAKMPGRGYKPFATSAMATATLAAMVARWWDSIFFQARRGGSPGRRVRERGLCVPLQRRLQSDAPVVLQRVRIHKSAEQSFGLGRVTPDPLEFFDPRPLLGNLPMPGGKRLFRFGQCS
jgi:hypothetical protein